MEDYVTLCLSKLSKWVPIENSSKHMELLSTRRCSCITVTPEIVIPKNFGLSKNRVKQSSMWGDKCIVYGNT